MVKPNMLTIRKPLSFVVLITAALFANAESSYDKQVANNITPVGNVCVEGEACETAKVAATTADSGPKSAADIYQGSCSACHGSGILSAPKLGDVAAWTPRIAKGIDTLYANAIGGINAMPAKGNCASCSDDDIKAVVDYFVENTQ